MSSPSTHTPPTHAAGRGFLSSLYVGALQPQIPATHCDPHICGASHAQSAGAEAAVAAPAGKKDQI